MKFYILKLFLNSGERLKIYFSSKKKKISIEIYLEKVSSLTEKVSKCKISFFHPLNLSGVVLGENLSRSSFSPPQRFVGKKSFFKSHFLQTPSKTFPSIYSQTFPNPIPNQSQSHQSLPLKTKIQFYQNFLPAKRSANHSMFFVGCKGKFRHFNFAFQILHFTRGFDD